MVEIVFAENADVKGTMVFPVWDNESVQIDMLPRDLLESAVEQADFSGKKNTFCRIYTDKGSVLLFGLGKCETAFDMQELGGLLYKKIEQEEKVFVCIKNNQELILNIALGIELASYRFDKYFTRKKKEDFPQLEKVVFVVDNPQFFLETYKKSAALANGVRFARDLCNEPANVLTPAAFAAEAERLSYLGLEVDILSLKDIKKLGMNLLLSVAQGAVNEPKVVVVRWRGNPKKKDFDVAFVGKGVTFDSGGISLKPGNGMWDMKGDMTGAAVVTAVMKTAALQKNPHNLIAVAGMVENMPSGSATRPGDVVTSMSGQTVEILNTDAEGRLVLADILCYVQKKYNVKKIIDVATLTGATMRALGNQYAGLFGMNDVLAEKLLSAGERSGERLWRLPMNEEYNKWMDSDIADVKNLSSTPNAGGSTAACFLNRFIEKDVAWAHLDIAGVDKEEKGAPLVSKGATGFGVRLLTEYLKVL